MLYQAVHTCKTFVLRFTLAGSASRETRRPQALLPEAAPAPVAAASLRRPASIPLPAPGRALRLAACSLLLVAAPALLSPTAAEAQGTIGIRAQNPTVVGDGMASAVFIIDVTGGPATAEPWLQINEAGRVAVVATGQGSLDGDTVTNAYMNGDTLSLRTRVLPSGTPSIDVIITIVGSDSTHTTDPNNPSATVTVTAPPAPATPPAAPGAPTGLMATGGQQAIALSWTAPTGVTGITGYRIESSADGTSGWTDLVPNTERTATQYVHVGLAADRTVHYRVSAITADGPGAASGTASSTALATSRATASVVAQETTVVGDGVNEVVFLFSVSNSVQLDTAYTITGSAAITGDTAQDAPDTSSPEGFLDGEQLRIQTVALAPGSDPIDVTFTVASFPSGLTESNHAAAVGMGSATVRVTAPAAPVPNPVLIKTTAREASRFTNAVTASRWFSQSFTTGSHADGYDIDSVLLLLNTTSGNTLTTTSAVVTLREDDGSGDPSDTVLATMQPPSMIRHGRLATFSAPSGGITLEASTKYHIVAHVPSGGADSGIQWRATAVGGGEGIDRYQSYGGTLWVEEFGTALMFQLRGSEIATATAPAAPTGLMATAGPLSIVLSWTAPGDDGGAAITGYQIERADTVGACSSSSTFPATPLVADTGGVAVTYTDTGLTEGATWCYRVSAINSEGAGAASGTASATAGAAAPLPTSTALVSNTDVAGGGTRSPSNTNSYAQPFTTGGHSGGYNLAGIALQVSLPIDFDASVPVVVTLRADDSGNPASAVLYTLTTAIPQTQYRAARNTANVALLSFNAPDGAALAANTTYFVVVEQAVSTGDFSWRQVQLVSGLDAGGAAGWTIGDTFRIFNAGAWGPSDRTTHALKIRVTGSAVGGPVLPTVSVAAADIEAVLAGDDREVVTTGNDVVFLFTRDITEGALTVNIAWSTTSALANMNPPTTVAFADGAAEARLALASAFVPIDGVIVLATMTLQRSAGYPDTATYAVAGPLTVTVRVRQQNTPAEGQPAVLGTPEVGQELTLGVGTFTDPNSTLPEDIPDIGLVQDGLDIRWQREDAPGGTWNEIAGEMTSVYTLAAPADLGKRIRFTLSYTDSIGYDEMVTSTPTPFVVAMGAAAPAAQVAAANVPTITGTLQVGEELEADTDDITDSNGLGTFRYQWRRADDAAGMNAVDIGTDADTYTLVAADQGKYIRVIVTFVDAVGYDEIARSEWTATAVEAAVTPDVLFSNLDQTRVSPTASVRPNPTFVSAAAQSFQTGSEVNGYILGEVEMDILLWGIPRRPLIVELREDSAGNPAATALATLTNPANLHSNNGSGRRIFTAPTGTGLKPDTVYHIVLRLGMANGAGPNMQFTPSASADERLAGWRLPGLARRGNVDATGDWNRDRDRLLDVYYSIGLRGSVAPAPTTAPGAPQNLAATAGPLSIVLEWDDPAGAANAGITGYRIERADAPGDCSGTPTFPATPLLASTGSAATTHTDMGLTEGETRCYRVSAINAIGTGAVSGTASATAGPPNTVPDAPTNLMATAGAEEIALAWTAPANTGGVPITGYRIERADAVGDCSGTPTFEELVADTGDTAVTYTDMGLTAGDTWCYQVSAINAVGTGAASGSAFATAVAVVLPGAPTGLSATAHPQAITLSWTAPTDTGGGAITGYRIETSADGSTGWTELVADTERAALEYDHVGLASGTAIHYRVSAINAAGVGMPSGTANATPNALSSGRETASVLAQDATVVGDGASEVVFIISSSDSMDLEIHYTITGSAGVTGSSAQSNVGEIASRFIDGEHLRIQTRALAPGSAPVDVTFTFLVGTNGLTNTNQAIAVGMGSATVRVTAPSSVVPNPVLLRNTLGGTTDGDLAVSANRWHAQPFRTGSHAAGYDIDSVALLLSTADGSDLASTSAVVTIRTDDGDNPSDTIVATMQNPSSIRHERLNFFTAPSGTRLDPSTWYHVVLSQPAAAAAAGILWKREGRLPNSSFGVRRVYRGTSWGAISMGEPPNMLLLQIRGSEAAAPVAPAPGPAPSFGSATITAQQWQIGTAVMLELPVATGGDGALRYTLAPALPNGVQLSGAPACDPGCSISGTPAGVSAVRQDETYTWRADDADADTADSDAALLNFDISVAAVAPVTPPTGLQAFSDVGQIRLSWTAPSDDGGTVISGYRIERASGDCSGSPSFTERVANTGNTDLTHTDTGLTAGDAWCYRVSAINTAGRGPASGADAARVLAMGEVEVELARAALDAVEGAEDATLEITVNVSPAPAGDLSIPYEVVQATGVAAQATADADFTLPAGPLTISAGTGSGVITATILADNVSEPAEGFAVMLGTPTSADAGETPMLGSGVATVVTIAANDPLAFALTTSSESVAEGERVTYTLAPAAGSPEIAPGVELEFAWAISGGDATAGDDYTTDPADTYSGTLTFSAADAAAQTVSVNIELDDTPGEVDETFMFSVATPANAATETGGLELTPAGGALTTTITDTTDIPPVFGGVSVSNQLWTQSVSVSLALPTASGGNGALSYTLEGELPGGVVLNGAPGCSPGCTLSGASNVEIPARPYRWVVRDSDRNTEADDIDVLTFTITVQAVETHEAQVHQATHAALALLAPNVASNTIQVLTSRFESLGTPGAPGAASNTARLGGRPLGSLAGEANSGLDVAREVASFFGFQLPELRSGGGGGGDSGGAAGASSTGGRGRAGAGSSGANSDGASLAGAGDVSGAGGADGYGAGFGGAPGAPGATRELAFAPARPGALEAQATENNTRGRGADDVSHWRPQHLDTWLGTQLGDWQKPDLRSLLLQSSFSIGLGAAHGADAPGAAGGSAGRWTLWGQGAATGFEGREKGSTLWVEGESVSAYLGADVQREGLALGLALGLSTGDLDYSYGKDAGSGKLETELTSLYPYLNWSPNHGFNLYLMLGYGVGEGKLEVENLPSRLNSDLSMRMVALGGRRTLSGSHAGRRYEVKMDAFMVELDSEGARAPEGGGVDWRAVDTQSGRLRMALAGSAPLLRGSETLLAEGELAARLDGGDAQTGVGAELGAGLRWLRGGLSLAARGRLLLVHSESDFEDYREWGASLEASYDAGEVGRGFRATLSPVWGDAQSGAGALYESEGALEGFSRGGASGQRRSGLLPDHLAFEFGYGLGLLGGRATLLPFGSFTFAGGDSSNTQLRVGARFDLSQALGGGGDGALAVQRMGVELFGEEQAQAGAVQDRRVGLELRLGF